MPPVHGRKVSSGYTCHKDTMRQKKADSRSFVLKRLQNEPATSTPIPWLYKMAKSRNRTKICDEN